MAELHEQIRREIGSIIQARIMSQTNVDCKNTKVEGIRFMSEIVVGYSFGCEINLPHEYWGGILVKNDIPDNQKLIEIVKEPLQRVSGIEVESTSPPEGFAKKYNHGIDFYVLKCMHTDENLPRDCVIVTPIQILHLRR